MILATTLASAIACASTSADYVNISNIRHINRAGIVSLQAGGAFEARHPGVIVADVEFQAQVDPQSGNFIVPDLEAVWAIVDANGDYVSLENIWHGGSDEPTAPAITHWDRATGTGTAEVTMRLDTEVRSGAAFPKLPLGACTIELKMGDNSNFHTDGVSYPAGVLWEGAFDLDVSYPELLASVTQQAIVPGKIITLEVFRQSPSGSVEQITVETIGVPQLTPIQGAQTNGPWTFDLLAGNQHMFIQFTVGSQSGPFILKATDSAGSSFYSQHLAVLSDYPIAVGTDGTVYASLSGGGAASQSSQTEAEPIPVLVDGKYCRLAYRGATGSGIKRLNCTAAWVTGLSGAGPNAVPEGILNGPLSPNCGTPSKAIFFPTKCKGNDGHCLFGPKFTLNAQELVYTGEQDIEAGSVSLAIGTSATGTTPLKWLVGGVEVGATVTGIVTAKVYKTCCVFTYSGGSLPVTSQNSCQ